MKDDDNEKVVDFISAHEESLEDKMKERPFSGTLLKLKWFAEQFRTSKKIQGDIRSGSYKVDNEKLAKALLNIDEK